METTQVLPKEECPHEDFDWVYSQEHFHRAFEFPQQNGLVYPMDRVFEYDPSLFSYQTNYNLPNFVDLRELEDHFLFLDQNLPSCNGVSIHDHPDGFDHYHEVGSEEHLTQLPSGNDSEDSLKIGGGFSDLQSVIHGGFSGSWKHEEGTQQSSRSKTAALEMDDIKKYFNVPITRAAKELKVGLTVLKKRCRELNITRWPHRKIKSLKALITNAKELGLTEEIEMLEEHKRMLEKQPEMELTEKAKKLRQACFKANYKRKRALQAPFTQISYE